MRFYNILVTGGCGFIGSNFIKFLFDLDDFTGNVVNIDKLTYAGNPNNLTDIDLILLEADKALYEAKNNGRNQLVVSQDNIFHNNFI